MEYQKAVTDQEYISWYTPAPGWLLIQKDLLPEKIGKIIIAEKIREDTTRTTGSGIVVAIGESAEYENEYIASLVSRYAVGDRVGFGITVPLISPAPPTWTLSEVGSEKGHKFVTLHVSDILCKLRKD